MGDCKLQIGCVIIVLFIATVYFSAKRVRSYSHILFSLSLGTTVFNLLFDMLTVYMVNESKSGKRAVGSISYAD